MLAQRRAARKGWPGKPLAAKLAFFAQFPMRQAFVTCNRPRYDLI